MSAPTVSVVIPTYNRESVVGAAIDSALGQTHPSIEVVVVDDGSTDTTLDVLSGYGDSIVVHRQENSGVAAARNAGIAASSGAVVMFVDSDEALLPEAAALHVMGLSGSSDAVASMGDLILASPDGTNTSLLRERKVRPTMFRGLWMNPQDVVATRFLFTNQTVAFRRSVLDGVGWFDESLWVMEDFDFALRLSAAGPWAFTSIPVAVRTVDSVRGLTDEAESDPARLHETIESICERALSAETLTSGVARRAVARMLRRARRRHPDSSSVAASIAGFVDEGLIERVYRNAPWFPRADIQPFPADTTAA